MPSPLHVEPDGNGLLDRGREVAGGGVDLCRGLRTHAGDGLQSRTARLEDVLHRPVASPGEVAQPQPALGGVPQTLDRDVPQLRADEALAHDREPLEHLCLPHVRRGGQQLDVPEDRREAVRERLRLRTRLRVIRHWRTDGRLKRLRSWWHGSGRRPRSRRGLDPGQGLAVRLIRNTDHVRASLLLKAELVELQRAGVLGDDTRLVDREAVRVGRGDLDRHLQCCPVDGREML